MGVGVVAADLDMIEAVVEQAVCRLQGEGGEGPGFAREHGFDEVRVVQVEVDVGAHPDDLAGGVAALVCQHADEEGGLEDVEGEAQAQVAAALVEDAGQAVGAV